MASRSLFRFGLAAAVVGAWAGMSAAPLAGQVTLAEAEVQYRQAVATYEGVRGAVEDASLDWEQALERVDAARGTDAEESARASSHQTALDLMALELETQEARAQVEATRVAWLRLLEARESEILEQRSDGPASAALAEELLQVRRRVAELRQNAGLGEVVALRPVPELVVDPRDGISDLLAKQNLMEEQVSRYELVISDIDGEVQQLQADLQRNQSVADFLRSVERFGSDLVSGAPLPPPVSGQGGDSPGNANGGSDGTVEASLASLPLEDRIANLREIRALAVQYRDEAVQMANTFRDLAQGGGR